MYTHLVSFVALSYDELKWDVFCSSKLFNAKCIVVAHCVLVLLVAANAGVLHNSVICFLVTCCIWKTKRTSNSFCLGEASVWKFASVASFYGLLFQRSLCAQGGAVYAILWSVMYSSLFYCLVLCFVVSYFINCLAFCINVFCTSEICCLAVCCLVVCCGTTYGSLCTAL